MTLVARTAPPAYHKKVSGNHHRRSKTYHKTYWPYLPLLGIVMLGLIFNSILPGKHSVLGYATDMSVQSLLNDTNAQRQANGEASLNLNSLLDNAAQAKANDMATRNYWSHNTPDGQTPWTFMTAAGYNYQLAGENLAYGFTTAADTLTGWMNSPGHRANILNAGYKEVGFGFIDIANYQNSGPETLVVAMYATPATVAAPAASKPVPPKSAPSKAATTTPVSTTPAASETAPSAAASTPSSSAAPSPPPNQTAVVTPATAKQATVQPEAHTISRVQLLTAGKAPQSLLLLSFVGSAAFIVFFLRHAFAWHKILIKGERFLLHHPLLDLALVSVATLALVMAQGSGVIR